MGAERLTSVASAAGEKETIAGAVSARRVLGAWGVGGAMAKTEVCRGWPAPSGKRWAEWSAAASRCPSSAGASPGSSSVSSPGAACPPGA